MSFQQICWRPKRMEPHRSIYSVTTRTDQLRQPTEERSRAHYLNQQTHSGGDDTMQTPRDICHWLERSKPQRDTCVWGSHWTLEPLARLRDFCHWRTCCHERDISRTWRQRATNKPVWYLAEYIYIGILIRTKAFAINVKLFVYYGLNSGLSTFTLGNRVLKYKQIKNLHDTKLKMSVYVVDRL